MKQNNILFSYFNLSIFNIQIKINYINHKYTLTYKELLLKSKDQKFKH